MTEDMIQGFGLMRPTGAPTSHVICTGFRYRGVLDVPFEGSEILEATARASNAATSSLQTTPDYLPVSKTGLQGQVTMQSAACLSSLSASPGLERNRTASSRIQRSPGRVSPPPPPFEIYM